MYYPNPIPSTPRSGTPRPWNQYRSEKSHKNKRALKSDHMEGAHQQEDGWLMDQTIGIQRPQTFPALILIQLSICTKHRASSKTGEKGTANRKEGAAP